LSLITETYLPGPRCLHRPPRTAHAALPPRAPPLSSLTLIRCEHRREGKAHLIFPTRSSSIASAFPRRLPPLLRREPSTSSPSPVALVGAPILCQSCFMEGPERPVIVGFPSNTDTSSMIAPSSHSPQLPPTPPAPPRHRIAHRPVHRHHRPLLRLVTDDSSSLSRTIVEDPILVSNFLPPTPQIGFPTLKHRSSALPGPSSPASCHGISPPLFSNWASRFRPKCTVASSI
jgi:hypothetical protein